MQTFLGTSINQFIVDIEDFMNRSMIKDDQFHLIDYGEQTLLNLYSIALHKLYPDLLQLFEFGTNQSNRGDLLLQDLNNEKLILVEAKKHTSKPDAYLKWADEIKPYYERIINQTSKYYEYISPKVEHEEGYEHLIMTITFDTNPNHKMSGDDWQKYKLQLENEYFYYKGFEFKENGKGLAIYGIIDNASTLFQAS